MYELHSPAVHWLQGLDEGYHQNIKEKGSSIKVDSTLEGIDDIQDLFKLEVLNGEHVYTCNVCNHGFDMEAEIKKQIMKDKKKS